MGELWTKLHWWLTPPPSSDGPILSPEEKLARTPSHHHSGSSHDSSSKSIWNFKTPNIGGFKSVNNSILGWMSKKNWRLQKSVFPPFFWGPKPLFWGGWGVFPSVPQPPGARSSGLSFSAYRSFISSLPRRSEVMRSSAAGRSHWKWTKMVLNGFEPLGKGDD